jgi:hypothetical protein
MPEEKQKPTAKTIEMRVAELEDKLAKMHVTEEEMRAYEKVSALMGGGAAASPSPVVGCVVSRCTVVQRCTIRCTVIQRCTIRCIIADCINECGGGCAPGGGAAGGAVGGFGELGY